jgi:hydroxymethylpyrimidine/phosphomethylpyrimidine kinase
VLVPAKGPKVLLLGANCHKHFWDYDIALPPRYLTRMMGRVLTVAGSDSGGGAGIQADIKTITALGGYAMSAITALTAQNTCGVFGTFAVDPEFVGLQIECVLQDIGADAIKTGMLHSADVVEVVVRALKRHASGVPLIVDPVMVAKGGSSLMDAAALHVIKRHLLPLAALVTPNIPEAEALTGLQITGPEQVSAAIDALLALGPSAVLLKGGHMPGDEIVDVLRTIDGDERRFSHTRIASTSTHGTGCTLASAIATGIAEGLRLVDSVVLAEKYVRDAIRFAPGLGKGHGPLDHAYPLRSKPQDTADELAGEGGTLPTGNA